MSRSTYNRFINNRIDVSASKFLMLIHHLNLSFGEFEYLNPSLSLTLFQKCQKVMTDGNLTKIKQFQQGLLALIKKDKGDLNRRIKCDYCLITLFKERLEKVPLNAKCQKIIKHYLLSRNSWTYYELKLFNDSLFAFNINTVILFMPRVLKDLNHYNYYHFNENEQIRILVNVVLRCIYYHKITEAKRYLKIMLKIHLDNNMLLEKLLLKYIQNLLLIVNQKENGKKEMGETLACLHFLTSRRFYNSYKHFYLSILTVYHLKH